VNRGLTMLELLIAVAITAAVAVLTISWTQTAVQISRASMHGVEWERAAQAALDLMGQLLSTGDLAAAPDTAGDRNRVVVESERIAFRGREAMDRQSAFWSVIELDSSCGSLTLSLLLRGEDDLRRWSQAPTASRRLLLSGVRAVRWSKDSRTGVLDVQIESEDHRIAERRFLSP